MPQTRSTGYVGTSQDGANPPNAPPAPPSMAEAIAALMHATTENSRLIQEMAHNNNHNGNSRRNHQGETRYGDFLETRPPVFSKAEDPLEADDWLRVIEQKLAVNPCSEIQKAVFAAQQLRGPASAWWGNFLDIQPMGHQVTWMEFRIAFREHHIPEGIMKMKLEEFLQLKQGNMSVVQYVGRFNYLSQYAKDQVNTDEKKKDCFLRGLDPKLQVMLLACTELPFSRLVSKAITAEEKYRQKQESKKKRMPMNSFGGNMKRQKIIYHPQNHVRFTPRPP